MAHKKHLAGRSTRSSGTMDLVEEYFRLFPNVNINDLNDDCLITIFSHIPLAEMLRLEIVCHRWKDLQEALFKSRRNKLVLKDVNFIGLRTPNQEIKNSYLKQGVVISKAYHHLRVDLAKKKNAELLLNKFPNICKLEVVYDKLDPIVGQLMMLLQAWKANLFHLKVIIYDSHDASDSWKRLFVDSISKLPLLKQLTIKDTSSQQILFQQNRNNNLTPLVELSPELASRLEHFYFGLACETMSRTFGLLDSFGANSKLQKLALINPNFNDNFGPSFDNVDDSFAQSVTDLTIFWNKPRNRGEDVEQRQAQLLVRDPAVIFLNSLCNKFTSVTYLHLTLQQEFAEMAPKLVKLKQLTDLRLQFSSKIFLSTDITTRVPALPSIQTLHLDCLRNFNISHGVHYIPHNELRFVEHLLPNLSVIKLNIFYEIGEFHCQTCNSDSKESCRNAFLDSLNTYKKLRRVYLLTSNGYSGWEEIFDDKTLAKFDVNYMLSGKQVLTVKQSISM